MIIRREIQTTTFTGTLSISEGEQIQINRNGSPFMIAERVYQDRIKYGPIGDDGQALDCECFLETYSTGISKIKQILELNSGNKLSIITSEKTQ
tara:strand:+ start:77 stop:358 length:282 start_codon:yes stop_codon:yes gene_type:complete